MTTDRYKLTDDDKRMLGTLCTRDGAGKHFTETHSAEWLGRMEAAGIITISRPYSEGILAESKFWSIGMMPNVPGITDEHGYLIGVDA